MGIYVVDTNFFIQAHRNIYPLDVAHGFWSKVKDLAHAGLIYSIDKVQNEIYSNPDDLTTWCMANLPSNFFLDSRPTLASQYPTLVAWANSRRSHYLPRALNEFLHADEADAFLVAYAMCDPSNITIVTYEISQPAAKNRIKIPEACNANGVNFCNTIAMFRALGVTF